MTVQMTVQKIVTSVMHENHQRVEDAIKSIAKFVDDNNGNMVLHLYGTHYDRTNVVAYCNVPITYDDYPDWDVTVDGSWDYLGCPHELKMSREIEQIKVPEYTGLKGQGSI